MRFKYLFLLSLCGAVIAGCGKSADESKIPKTDSSLTDAQGQPIAFDVESLRLKELLDDPDPRIKNNAAHAFESLKGYDFSNAMYGLTALASMNLNPTQTEIVASSMKEVVGVVKAAAEGGNENAKFALRILADSGF